MNISKSMFKNFSRCSNYCALYDLYCNRSYNNIKNIDKSFGNIDFEEFNNIKYDEDIEFENLLNEMFDEETGVDLLEKSNNQLLAFAKIYNQVEELAIRFAERIFKKKIISSPITKEQKVFSHVDNNNTFYCYLDGYMEYDGIHYIFEVKSTTSRKFDNIYINTKNHQLPVFIKNDKGIYENHLNDYLGLEYDDFIINDKHINKIYNKFLDPYDECGKYIYDLAIEKYIIENSTRGIIKSYLIVLNHEYIYDGKNCEFNADENGNELFKIYDFSEVVDKYQSLILFQKRNIEKNLFSMSLNEKVISKSCEYKSTTQCKFFNICAKNLLKSGSILELINAKKAFKDPCTKQVIDFYKVINDGFISIRDVYIYLTSPNNLCQYHCLINDDIYINKDMLSFALDQIKYPIYYLDFESYNSPLPRYKGENPYMQSVFQYSLHIEKSKRKCDIKKNHHEYLAPDHNDHREDLTKKLIKDIDLSHGGTIIVYNENFERSRLKELSIIFPEYSEQLLKIYDHIYDLFQVLRGVGRVYKEYRFDKNNPTIAYYNNNLHGSFSIKKVLPIFSNLNYNNLEVKNGTEAIITYGMLPNLTNKEYEEKYISLRRYCRQDTWAMVEILWKLQELIEKKE